MAVCLDYQSVYSPRKKLVISVPLQMSIAVLALLMLAVKVWIKIEIIDLGYKLAQEQELAIEYDMLRRDLDLQRSILLRPDNLAQMAHDRLGLEALDPKQARKLTLSTQG